MERDTFVAQLPEIYRSLRAYARWARCRDVEDVVQEAVMVTWAQVANIKGDDALPYALGVLKNLLCQSWGRAQRAPILIGDEALDQAVVEPMAAPPQERRVMVRQVGDLIERRLDPKRRVVVLADLWGYSRAETAKLLGLREGTVKSRTSRGYADLRAAWEGAERSRQPMTKDRARRPALCRSAGRAAPLAKVPPCGEGDIRQGLLSGPDPVLWRKLQRWLRLGDTLAAPASRGWPWSDQAAA
jgi:RNA polymerase sigma-70 factor (ECF subfamily)